MSEILRELHEELRRNANSPFDCEFNDLPFISIEERIFLMDIHPHNPRYKLHWSQAFDSNYDYDWSWLQIEKSILEDFSKIQKKKVVKVVKKLTNNIHCITLSPNPELHQDKEWLHSVVRRVVNGCKVVKWYGVFERGNKNDIYHTHFLIEYENDKNQIQNLKKFFKKINTKGLKEEMIYKIEKVGGPIHLLKCLRYFEKNTKKNFGYYEKDRDGRKEFYTLTNTEIPELKWNPKIKI